MLEVGTLDTNDYGVCTNYLTEEYESIVGPVTYRVSGKFYSDVSAAEYGYKVSDGSKIVAFVAFQKYDSAIALVNFYVAPEYRFTKAFYLISREFGEHLDDDVAQVMYLPIKTDMVLPASVCENGVLHINTYKDKLAILEKRWGDG